MRKQPLNRLVERDPLSRNVDIWEARDEGDPIELVFKLPRKSRYMCEPTYQRLVEQAFREQGRAWIEYRAKLGWYLVPGQEIVCWGPEPCLEMEDLDKVQFGITGRFKREKPLRMRTADAEDLLTTQPEVPLAERSVRNIIAPIAAAPELIEANARATAQAKADVEKARAAWEEMDRTREDLGLPAYTGDEEGD